MLLLVFKVVGWSVAHFPEWLLRGVSALLGEVMFAGLRRRRRLILSNLHHAFPDRSAAWHRRIGRESCRRMVETALLSLATPYLSEARIRNIARLAPSVETLARDLAAAPRPVVLATLHLALWESQTWLKLLSPVPLPEFGIIFRPLDNPAADAFVKATRERFGMRLLSRREGFAEALGILRNRGCVGILFDQNAGMQGALSLLLDRVCSTTELPGLLAAKFGADVRTFYPRRTGFWRVQFESCPVPHDGTTEGVTVALNRWLGAALAGDDDLCASWLWAHDRWRNQDVPARRLRLEAKRNLLATALSSPAPSALPRRTRIWVRMPNWLGDVVMVLPLLRAMRVSRPDAEFTLLAKRQFLPLLSSWGIGDRLEALPPRGWRYAWHFWRRRSDFPDVHLLFTNSFRGDLEAWLLGARQRFGIVRPGKRRPLLTHAYAVPPDFDEGSHHQLELWENFLRHFGLATPPDRAPVEPPPGAPPGRGAIIPAPIGLIPGSENTPEKRWPVAHWRALVDALPSERFVVFGTPNDRPIADAVAAGFAPDRVTNLAGKTDLATFAARLAECRLLVTNDTGGMHLANALGVPLIGLFGPTNPVRTGPVFAAPVEVLQPPGSPATGGRALADLPPEMVAARIHALLTAGSMPA
ncbi:MAG TPA: glycosyltransferase family 9 protein [Opitutaceae bacterium]|nr:glycosyltransferase family 9 protein [Opitutaceae bacterium]